MADGGYEAGRLDQIDTVGVSVTWRGDNRYYLFEPALPGLIDDIEEGDDAAAPPKESVTVLRYVRQLTTAIYGPVQLAAECVILEDGTFQDKVVDGEVRTVVVKVINKKCSERRVHYYDQDKHVPENAVRELGVYSYFMREGGHENLLESYGIGEDEDWYYLALERCSHDLRHEINRNSDFGTARGFVRGRSLLVDILAGLAYMNLNHMIHLDVSIENVLIAPDGRAVLMDFGTVFDGLEDPRRPLPRQSTAIGKVRCWAPEIGLRQEWDERADIWSLGVLVYQMLIRADVPWKRSDRPDDVLSRIALGQFPDMVRESGLRFLEENEHVLDVMTALLTLNYRDRPSLVDILRFPWIAEELENRKEDETEENPADIATRALKDADAIRTERLAQLELLRAPPSHLLNAFDIGGTNPAAAAAADDDDDDDDDDEEAERRHIREY